MNIENMLALMAQLRDEKTGCPWDKAQTMATIVPFTLEEAYELADAIEGNRVSDIKSELGDLLFQVIFYAQIAKEKEWFDFNAIVDGLHEKLTTRHPHVFSKKEAVPIEQLHHRWENQKLQERSEKGAVSLLDDVPKNFPSLSRAQKLQKRAAMVGFDWPSVEPIFDKIREEYDECKTAVASGDQDAIADEIGDLMFTCVNLARYFKLDSEAVLRQANQKFETRFRKMELMALAAAQDLNTLSAAELDRLWEESKLS